MVDEAAKEVGYDTPKLYHGTGAYTAIYDNGNAMKLIEYRIEYTK